MEKFGDRFCSTNLINRKKIPRIIKFNKFKEIFEPLIRKLFRMYSAEVACQKYIFFERTTRST